ncbi:hypothetical protein [Maribacter antarcticus]|uniref:hypothetical protein n=1 Tax=Maribacter antarcticus TaxID=505250 RepID=UPI00047E254F|nr:hypothetical protein [Maribacter antarcticus]
MKFSKQIRNISYVSLVVLFTTFGCKNAKTDTSKEEVEIEEISEEEDKIGGFLPKTSFTDETVDLEDSTVVITDFDVKGFPKKMETYGTLFVMMDGVPDEFVKEVALTFHQMFPQDSLLDLKQQQQVLSTMLQYKSLIPVLKGRYESLGDDFEQSMETLSNDYSICDIIMYKDGTGRQTMEVVEHLLHYVTSIGLHLNLPKEWSFTDADSEVTKVMNKAVELGLYDISGYGDMRDEKEVYQRIIVQEFSYWLISTYWDLQEPYGNLEEEEWNIDNKKKLLEKLPDGYNLVETTVNKFMKSPSMESLEKFRKYN